MTNVTTSGTGTSTSQARRLRPAVGWLLGAGIALAINLTILLIANLMMDGSVQVARPGGGAEPLAVIAIVAASVLPLAFGALALAVLARLIGAARGLRYWSIAVAGFAVLSIAAPWTLPVTVGSMMALTAMHLATGTAAILGQRLAARR